MLRDRSFSMFEKYPEKLLFLTSWYTCAYKGVRNISFSENIAYELNEWSLRHLSIFCERNCITTIVGPYGRSLLKSNSTQIAICVLHNLLKSWNLNESFGFRFFHRVHLHIPWLLLLFIWAICTFHTALFLTIIEYTIYKYYWQN